MQEERSFTFIKTMLQTLSTMEFDECGKSSICKELSVKVNKKFNAMLKKIKIINNDEEHISFENPYSTPYFVIRKGFKKYSVCCLLDLENISDDIRNSLKDIRGENHRISEELKKILSYIKSIYLANRIENVENIEKNEELLQKYLIISMNVQSILIACYNKIALHKDKVYDNQLVNSEEWKDYVNCKSELKSIEMGLDKNSYILISTNKNK